MANRFTKWIGRIWPRSNASALQSRVNTLTAALVSEKVRNRHIEARYDAAQNSDEFKNLWAAADQYDADSAHSPMVRRLLIARSRYEIGNNGFSDGIARTSATDVVGRGPTLRMETGSVRFNQMVEREWQRWAKAVQLRRKLWCMAHAKHSDGEAFAVLRRNPKVKHQIPLDVVLYEAEQFASPYLAELLPGRIDGIEFDEFGNPTIYELMRYHPGSTSGGLAYTQPERIPADRVCHWFRLRRPGQHRQVPEMSSTLNCGAAARRWREATIGAAETAADFALMLQTNQNAAADPDPVAAMSTFEIEKRMMTALPVGYSGNQLKAEHPNATFAEFNRALVNEQARPKSMPFNKAACDSSSYNYASGRLDHQTYYAEVDVERDDCDDLCLDKIFVVWFELAIVRFGWLGGDPAQLNDGAYAHSWDWPKHKVADVKVEASANETKLKSAQISLRRLYAEAGLDLEDEIQAMASDYGVGPDAIRARLLEIILPLPKQQPAPRKSDGGVMNGARRRRKRPNGTNGHRRNGVPHAPLN